ncbi:TPA: hypothetical protein ENS27_02025 [bacterium]|nr:hypothetical protein [bacterium]
MIHSHVKIYFLILFFIIFFLPQYIISSPITVPLEHWSYQFIERFQTKGILREYLSNIKPYSRDEVAEMIFKISKSLDSGEINLTNTEKKQLELLKSEFNDELTRLGILDIPEYKSFINWRDKQKRFVVQIGYNQDAEIKRGTEDSHSTLSTLQVASQANFGDSFFFYNDTRASYNTKPLSIWHPYIDADRYPWNAMSNAYIIFGLKWTNLQIGKDTVLWGPGYHGVVELSAIDPAFDLIRFPIEFWKMKLTNMMGFLRDENSKDDSKLDKKYLFAHRLEYYPINGVCIGWQEAYIYDKIHISLLNPVMPYQMAEDYLGQVGNNTMALDLDLCLIPDTRFYSALFLNDFHPEESFFTYSPNSWSILGGILITDPFKFRDSDFRIEYARVEPWAYSHKNINQTYSHFGIPLGHWMGSNSDDLLFEANNYITDNFTAKLSYNRIRTGEIGSSFYDYFTSKGLEKRFLEGITEKRHEVSLAFEYRIFQDSTINVGYSYILIKNKQNEEAKLPPKHKQKQSWQLGKDLSQNSIQLSIKLKY